MFSGEGCWGVSYPPLLACLTSFAASVIFSLIYGNFSCIQLSGLQWGNSGMETVLRQHKILKLCFLFCPTTVMRWSHSREVLINLADHIALLQEASHPFLSFTRINHPLGNSQIQHSSWIQSVLLHVLTGYNICISDFWRAKVYASGNPEEEIGEFMIRFSLSDRKLGQSKYNKTKHA